MLLGANFMRKRIMGKIDKYFITYAFSPCLSSI